MSKIHNPPRRYSQLSKFGLTPPYERIFLEVTLQDFPQKL